MSASGRRVPERSYPSATRVLAPSTFLQPQHQHSALASTSPPAVLPATANALARPPRLRRCFQPLHQAQMSLSYSLGQLTAPQVFPVRLLRFLQTPSTTPQRFGEVVEAAEAQVRVVV